MRILIVCLVLFISGCIRTVTNDAIDECQSLCDSNKGIYGIKTDIGQVICICKNGAKFFNIE